MISFSRKISGENENDYIDTWECHHLISQFEITFPFSLVQTFFSNGNIFREREKKRKEKKIVSLSLSLYDSIRFCFHSKLIDDATYESYLERITNKSCKYTDSTTTLFDDTTTTNVNSEIISQSIDEFIR